MNTTCHVDLLRANSGRYPKDSRLESAWGLSILSSAIFCCRCGGLCAAQGIIMLCRNRGGLHFIDDLHVSPWHKNERSARWKEVLERNSTEESI